MLRVGIALVLLVAAATTARAEPKPAPALVKQAKVHYRQGMAFHQSGRYDDAIQEYRAAYELIPQPELLFDIAQAYRLKGDRSTAIEYYRRYLDVAPNGRVHDKARAHLASLIHTLEIEEAVAARNKPTPPAPGAAQQPTGAEPAAPVRGEAASDAGPTPSQGPSPAVATVTTAPVVTAGNPLGGSVVVPGRDAEVQKAPESRGGLSRRTLGYGIGGVGVAALTVGTIAGILALTNQSTIDKNCDSSKACTPQGIDAVGHGKTLVSVNTWSWAIGAVFAGAGAYLVLTSPNSHSGAHAELVPAVLASGGGAALTGQF
jgi:hypothetical protein